MGKAVVSTSLGCEGLDVVSGEHLLIGDKPQDFARAVVELLQDDGRRASLGIAGRALAEREYSWQRCGEDVIEAVESIRRQSRECALATC